MSKEPSSLDSLTTLQTPGIVFSESRIAASLSVARDGLSRLKCQLLFPLKSMFVPQLLEKISPLSSGFAASSLFEARLARTISAGSKTVHFTSPGLRPDEIDAIAELCDAIYYNSLSQVERFHNQIEVKCQLGLRVNTELSFVADKRYDPSRLPSKLGVPLSTLKGVVAAKSDTISGLSGILIHSNCESEDFAQLLETVRHVESQIPELLEQIEWLNLGGGYLFDQTTDWGPFEESVKLLSDKYNLQVIFEPGRGIVGEAGYIVSSVLDIFDSGDKKIAVLDTTVNHMPEVFEYGYKPPIEQEEPGGANSYILAGATCLAGDLFGEYSFAEPLEIGSKLVFRDMGAYTLVKAHMFNGINLPSIYTVDEDGRPEHVKSFDYQDFLARCGAK